MSIRFFSEWANIKTTKCDYWIFFVHLLNRSKSIELVIFLIALQLVVRGHMFALSWLLIVPLDGVAGVGWRNFFRCWVLVNIRHHYIILHFSALNIIIIFFWISPGFIFDRLFFVRILRKCFLSEIWGRSLLCFGAFFEIRVRFLIVQIVLSS